MSKTQANTKVATPETNFGQSGNFVRENQKSLLFIGGAVVALIVIYFLYLKVYLGPLETKAANQMYVAQDFWAKKDWDKAINGDASYLKSWAWFTKKLHTINRPAKLTTGLKKNILKAPKLKILTSILLVLKRNYN
jgi:hypothetical protein